MSDPIQKDFANGMLTIRGLDGLRLAAILIDLNSDREPERGDLIYLPPLWQRLMVETAERMNHPFTYPTWKYHEGLDRWFYLPEAAWPNPGYCEGCGPDCLHCHNTATRDNTGKVLLSWDRISGGWMCASDNEEHLLSLEGVVFEWPKNEKP